MTKIGFTALFAALAASAALAQADPHAGQQPGTAAPAKPDGSAQSIQGCPMMNGRIMMNGSAMGAHMQNGHMVDKDGKTIMGGAMGPNGMMCVPQASANAQPGRAPPKADR